MSAEIYVKLKGQKSGPINGSVVQKGKENLVLVLNYQWSCTSPRDPTSGLPTGKRQHHGVTFTKPVDKASPVLENALFTNENLSEVEFTFYRASVEAKGGGLENYLKVKLTNANIASIVQDTVRAAVGGNQATAFEEVIHLTYEKYEITWVNGGIVADDSWSERM